MHADTLRKTLRTTVQEYASKPYRHVVNVSTWDGIDTTWQSSGAGDKRTDHHKQALLALDSLRNKVQMAGLPLQWLLDLSIVVETYDRKKREARRTEWAVVFVPQSATDFTGTHTYDNVRGRGVHVVCIGDGLTIYPAAAALDGAEA